MEDKKIKTENTEYTNGNTKLEIGDTVEQEFNLKIMKVIGFEPELVENVITEWEDEAGNITVGKFIESELKLVKREVI